MGLVWSWRGLRFNPLERGIGIGGLTLTCRETAVDCFNPLERGIGIGGF